ISLELILPPLVEILEENGSVLALIKPQFEAGRDRVGKNGIIKDPKVHEDVVAEVLAFTSRIGYTIQGLTFSPITGGEGNIEFLAHLKNSKESNNDSWKTIDIRAVVQEAHSTF